MLNSPTFKIRNAMTQDLALLLDLEQKWPEQSRATEHALKRRIERFAEGYFIAEDNTGIIGSIIAHPYYYDPCDLSNFNSWAALIKTCYDSEQSFSSANALYIVSGTSNKPHNEALFFNTGISLIIELAKKMGMTYVIAGALLPGYACFLRKHKKMRAEDYVFEKNKQRFVDPLIEKYRRIGFSVPDKHHVIANYFPDENSLNYSALVVKKIL